MKLVLLEPLLCPFPFDADGGNNSRVGDIDLVNGSVGSLFGEV